MDNLSNTQNTPFETTRCGKIARLPHTIRETLNLRLSDGEIGHTLLAWLNAQPEVQTILAEQFDSRPVTEQNLSEWRRGGYIDWAQKETLRDSFTGILEDLEDLHIGQPHDSISVRCAELQALALARLLMAAMVEPVSERREQRILALVRSINTVRRCAHDLERMRLQRERQQQEHVGEITLPETEAERRAPARTHTTRHECFHQEFSKTTDTTAGSPPPPAGAPEAPSIPVNAVHPVPSKPVKSTNSNSIQVNPTSEMPTGSLAGGNLTPKAAPVPLSGPIRPAFVSIANFPGYAPILRPR